MNYYLISEIILGSAVGAGVAQLLFKFLEKFFIEWRENSIRRQKEKRHCLDKVIDICTEASSSTYKKQPRDKEHILRIITDLETVDKEMAKLLERLFTNWQLLAQSPSTKEYLGGNNSSENRHNFQLIQEADEARIELIKRAKKKRG